MIALVLSLPIFLLLGICFVHGAYLAGDAIGKPNTHLLSGRELGRYLLLVALAYLSPPGWLVILGLGAADFVERSARWWNSPKRPLAPELLSAAR